MKIMLIRMFHSANSPVMKSKLKYCVSFLLLSTLIVLGTSAAFANPWAHRYATEQSSQNIAVDINTVFTVSVEWGQGGWDVNGSSFGYGTTTDGTGWTWIDLPWFQDGEGSNKRCRAYPSITTPGKYYYAYRFILGGNSSYSFGSDSWAENSGSLAAVSTITVGKISIAAGDWSSTSTWDGGTLPETSSNIGILHSVTLNQNASVKSVTIAASQTLASESGQSRSLNIATGGFISNNGTFTANDGTVTFEGAGTIISIIGFNHVNLSGGVDFGALSAINGTLTINPGGYVNTNAPTYSSGSTLKYNTGGDYAVASEWKSNTTSGQGVPHHIEIASSSPVRLTGAAFYQLNGNLSINAGKAFELSTTVGGDLQIKGNLVNNGTLTHQSRLITFNGSSAQEIQGGATTFAYVTIDNAAGVAINNTGTITIANNLVINTGKQLTINPGKSLTVSGTLTNSAGDGGLVIESDANGTGSLINNSENVNATIKQYVTPVTTWGVTQDGWHFLSSPVASQSISGSFIPVSNYDFFGFDESTYTWINKKAHPEMTTFIPGKGYLVSYALVDTKAFTGILNRGDLNVSITLTTSLPDNQEGWNLIGNPFCSSIDWDGVNLGGVAASAFYIRNAANDGWSSYSTNVGVNYNNDGNLPPMQGIFVRAIASGNITVPFSARLHSAQDFTKATTTLPDNIVKLRAVANNQSDETVVRLNSEATTGFDNSWDANKFISANGAIPQIYSKLNEVSYSINSVEVPDDELIIPVFVQVGVESDVELLQLDNTLLPELGYAIDDLKTGNRIELSAGSYFFHASPDDDAHRFNLRLGLKTSIPETATAIEVLSIYSSGNTVYLNSKSTLDAQISIYNITGQDVYQSNMKLDGLKQITINAPTGWYIVKAVSSGGVTSKKVFIN